MKYDAAKAAAFAIMIGTPFATFAAEKAPLADDMNLAAFRGIETMSVSGSELREVSGELAGRSRAGGPPNGRSGAGGRPGPRSGGNGR